jgi:hypothetical protein
VIPERARCGRAGRASPLTVDGLLESADLPPMASKGFFVSNCPNGRLQSGDPVETMKTTARLGGALEYHDAVGSECYDATAMLDRSLARLRDRTVLRLGLEKR